MINPIGVPRRGSHREGLGCLVSTAVLNAYGRAASAHKKERARVNWPSSQPTRFLRHFSELVMS